MDNRRKARTVLIQVGQPGAFVNQLTDAEVEELAKIHDKCLKPLESLGEEWTNFWGQRADRLDKAKQAKTKEKENASGGGTTSS